jgi:2-polyprenyl-3-methyl-5-hydroxy-6-metoxy-1,4-benzoquinol methylase
MTNLPHSAPPQPSQEPETGVKTAFESPQWYFDKLNYRVQLRTDVVRAWTADFHFKRFLDIGCGDGTISVPLLNPNRSLTLQDLSEAMLARARARVPAQLAANCETICGDFRQMELATGGYGLVICLGVLSYIDPIEPFLAKLTSMIEPGGHLILECSDSDHFVSKLLAAYSKLIALFWKPKVNIKLQACSGAAICQTIRKSGFRLIRAYRYSMPPPIIRKFFSQQTHVRMNRLIHGDPCRARVSWLGTEDIFCFQKQS